jgi:hypothetical protein
MEVEYSRSSLMLEQAVRIAMSSGKDGDQARAWWWETHNVQAHWMIPAESE